MIFYSFEELLEAYSQEDIGLVRKSGGSLVDSHRKRVDVSIPMWLEQPNFEPSKAQFLRVRSEFNYKQVIEMILYECLFGDPRVFQWFILFELLNSTKLYSEEAQALYDVVTGLTQSNSKNLGSPLRTMMSNMKPLRQNFGKEIANEIAETLRRNQISVPKKRTWSSDFCIVTTYTRAPKKAPEVRRIGVGYKDKGHLPLPGSEYDPEPLLLSEQHCPIKLWKRFRMSSKIK